MQKFFRRIFDGHSSRKFSQITPGYFVKRIYLFFIHLPIYLSIYLFIYLSICIYGESFISYNLIAFWNRPFLDNIFKSVDLMC